MHPIIVHTGGWNAAGDDVGPITVERLEKAWDAWRQQPSTSVIVVPSGSKAPATGERMCNKAREWLVEQGVPENCVVVPDNPRADNSIAEVIVAARLMREAGWEKSDSISVVSSQWHVYPRLRAIWKRFGDEFRPTFLSSGDAWVGLAVHFSEWRGALAVVRNNAGPRYTEPI